jgi:hypothetical protein
MNAEFFLHDGDPVADGRTHVLGVERKPGSDVRVEYLIGSE